MNEKIGTNFRLTFSQNLWRKNELKSTTRFLIYGSEDPPYRPMQELFCHVNDLSML